MASGPALEALATRPIANPEEDAASRLVARPAMRKRSPWLVLAVVSAGLVMILVDTTIVNIAVPSIISGLNASLDEVLWAINAYLLVYAVLLVPAGRLGDLYGQRNLFAIGLVLFTGSSVACGLAQDSTQLIIARVFQGAGGGLLTPQALALVTNAFAPERRGLALGLFGGLNALAAIAGPVLGGYVITAWSWRWIFGINVPLGIVALAGSFFVLPAARAGIRRGIDPIGIVLVGAGLLGVVYGLLDGERYTWGAISGPVGIPDVIGGGLILLGAFVVWELRHRGALLPLTLFRHRNYAVGNAIAALAAFSMLGLLLPVVLFCQVVLGLTPLGTAYALMPTFLALLFAAPIGGRLADAVGGKYVLLAGTAVSGVGFWLVLNAASVSASVHDLILPLAVVGLGSGLIMAPLFSMVMSGIPEGMVGAASGFVPASRQVGQVLGVAVIGGLLQNQLATTMHDQAVIYSSQLPVAARTPFVDVLSGAVRGGARQLGAAGAVGPNDLMHRLAHDVLTHAYIQAMAPTLAVGIVAMALAAIGSLAMRNRAEEGDVC